ncbi:hypothetical protein CR513_34041, partial [Mucuna pruriens]
MNRTLIKRVRCMLSKARLPKHFWGEALYTTVHVINLSPVVALNTKAFVHVPKDERSKLDMKTMKCIFIGYGHDEYGYRMYDHVEKKLVRSCDVQFMENQTIEDIDKVKKSTPKKDNNLSEIDPIRMPIHDLDTTDNNQHNYGDQQPGDGFDVPLDDDAEEEQEMSQDENLGDALEPPPATKVVLLNFLLAPNDLAFSRACSSLFSYRVAIAYNKHCKVSSLPPLLELSWCLSTSSDLGLCYLMNNTS